MCLGRRAVVRPVIVGARLLSHGGESQGEDTFLHRLARRFERYKPPAGDSHSKLLASAKHIYEIQCKRCIQKTKKDFVTNATEGSVICVTVVNYADVLLIV